MKQNTKKTLLPRRTRKKTKDTTLSSAQQVYREIPMIQLVGKAGKVAGGKKLQGQILHLSPSTVRAFSNITLNALNDRIPLSARAKKELEKRRHLAEKLASPKGSLSSKRKILQEGGFLPLLAAAIPAITSVVGSIISGITSKKH